MVHPGAPRIGALGEFTQRGDSVRSETAPRVQAYFDFSLVKPAAMLWRVMYGETLPYSFPALLAEVRGQRLQTMGVQIIHDQMDLFCSLIATRDVAHYFREGRPLAVRRGLRDVPSG